MFDRPKAGERAVLVQLAHHKIDTQQALQEFKELAKSAHAEIVGTVMGAREKPDATYFLGLGKVQELSEQVLALEASLVLVNHELSPSQERNLERALSCRVVGRSGLILDIFAQRARTFEGKLQVELAQLEHISTRLIRGWTHLERQKGGIGLRGPGETQLETDRRLLRARIKTIHKRLEKVRQSRLQNRRARQKAAMPTVALVGYTNAGKSSLFNALTGASIFVANQLFATLDPTMRKLDLPGSMHIILADTVGFIRDLPHDLIDAFRATLEEVKEADLLLHVIDIADVSWRESLTTVEKVLDEIGASQVPQIQVFNKIDLREGWIGKWEQHGESCKAWVSAKTGEGLDALKEAISWMLQGQVIEEEITLGAADAKLRSQLYALGAVLSETITEAGGWKLHVRLNKEEKRRVMHIS